MYKIYDKNQVIEINPVIDSDELDTINVKYVGTDLKVYNYITKDDHDDDTGFWLSDFNGLADHYKLFVNVEYDDIVGFEWVDKNRNIFY